MSIEVLVFDVDDTLIYTFETALERTRAAALSLDLPAPTPETFRADYGRIDFSACIRGWFPLADPDCFKRAYREQTDRFPYRSVTCFALLQERLERRGVTVGVLTNGPRASTMRKLDTAEVKVERLAFLLCAEDLPKRKPSPDAFAPVLELTGRRAEEHAYVADAPTDRASAKGAGLRFIAVRTGPHPCTDLQCDFTLDSVVGVEACL